MATIGGFVMTLFRTIPPAEATGKVKEVYEDIMATKNIAFDLDQCAHRQRAVW